MILEQLYDALYEEYNKERKGIHVSDLTLCPRESCFRRLQPKPLTNTDLNFFTSGKAIHEALQSLIKKYADRFEKDKEIKFNGIEGHIDLFDKQYHIPIEAKSARVKTMDKPKTHYITQLEAYMAITGAETGIILVQCLLNYGDDPFIEFEHTMTEQQRNQKLHELNTDATMLKIANAAQDPSLVSHIAYDNDLNWKCRYCNYVQQCEQMRLKVTEEQLKNHKLYNNA